MVLSRIADISALQLKKTYPYPYIAYLQQLRHVILKSQYLWNALADFDGVCVYFHVFKHGRHDEHGFMTV